MCTIVLNLMSIQANIPGHTSMETNEIKSLILKIELHLWRSYFFLLGGN